MPIRFRCRYCSKLLGIGRRKAGTETICPHCGKTITVPQVEDTTNESPEWDDLDRLLKAPDVVSPSVSAQQSAASGVEAGLPVHPVVTTSTAPESERPLFEDDIDAVLGRPSNPRSPQNRDPIPLTPTSGLDAKSLDHKNGEVVLSSRRMTGLFLVVGFLLALSFAAGFLVASVR